MSQEHRVLMTCDLGGEALARFARQPGFHVRVENIRDEETLARAVPGFHALIVRSNVQVTERVLAAGATELQIVGRAGIGVDNIDVESATRHGVAVVNAPEGNVVTTAEHAIAMLMSLARKIPQANVSMKALKWEKAQFVGRELRGKTLGIVGVGRVGSVVADRAQGLKMKVIAYDPYLSSSMASQIGVQLVSFDKLLGESDFISIHTPLTPETRGLIGRQALSRMKPGALIVNCARGGLLDEAALLEAIEAGAVAGAALDVFEKEPPPPNFLYQRDEVILTPHLGASTLEAQTSVALEVVENVISFLTTGVSPNTLNVPSLPPEALSRLGPYLELAERLGLFAAQVTDTPIVSARLLCGGPAAQQGAEWLTAFFLKGLLTPALSARVNVVNALEVARQRGIRVVSSTTSEVGDFTDLVTVRIEASPEEHIFEGTLFGKSEPRLVRFDEYRLDALPKGNLLLIYNRDVPGVIGSIGTCLGRHGVNISGMYNGRDVEGGKAISLVNIDGTATTEALSDLKNVPHILSVREVGL